MPEVRKSIDQPKPVNQELLLPTEFPQLPSVMVDRFGSGAREYQDDLNQFWMRTRRTLNDMHFSVSQPVNKMKETAVSKNYVQQVVEQGSASVNEELEALHDADDNLSAKYTLTATAGDVVTGMNVTSKSGPGRMISEIVFQADRLKVQSSTLPTRITMMDIKTNGIVFGTDIASNNFVSGIGGAGWRLTRDTGILECNNGLFRGAIYADAGLIGGLAIESNSLHDPAGLGIWITPGWVRIGPPTGHSITVNPDSLYQTSNSGTSMFSLTPINSGNNCLLQVGGNTSGMTIALNGGTGAASAVSFNATSSSRYKRNLRPIEGALQLLLRLQGCRFDWRTRPVTDDIGLIAEDVDAIFPTIVGHDDKGRADSLDYGKLTAVLIEAVREIDGRVHALEHQVARH